MRAMCVLRDMDVRMYARCVCTFVMLCSVVYARNVCNLMYVLCLWVMLSMLCMSVLYCVCNCCVYVIYACMFKYKCV